MILHLRTVRFLGHAGSDAELGYRREKELLADQERDPLLGTAHALLDAGLVTRGGAREVRSRPRPGRRGGA